MKALVLDSSALITGFGPYLIGIPAISTYTVREVIDEIKNKELKLKVELSLNDGSLKLVEPSKRALMQTKNMAEKSGDVSVLSDTDLKVVALACDLKEEGIEVSVMTDDYGIQNVSCLLGIAFSPAAESGIKQMIIWKNICCACRKEFPPNLKGECTHCGSPLKLVKSNSMMPGGDKQ
jgi:UPF0271 protein